MPIDIKLPPLGDNIASGDVLEVKVHVGDFIEREQGILEIETDKATVEVPSTHAGKVVKVHVQDGQTIPIGAPLITVEESGGATGAAGGSNQAAAAAPASPEAAPAPEASKPPAAKQAAPKQASPAAPAPTGSKSPSAGESATGAPASNGGARTASAAHGRQGGAAPPRGDGRQPNEPAEVRGRGEGNTPATSRPAGAGPIPAGPSVRRFAREVGVDLQGVAGSGPGGRIVRDDVLAIVRSASEAARGKAAGAADSAKAAESGERDAWGPVRSEKMSKIRKTIAAKMSESWTTAPRVTNFDDADVTELDRIRQSSRNDYVADGIKLTSLPFVIKAVAMALRKHPTINATVDVEQDLIIYKQYVHVGVAVDTERGLVVPVLRHADRLSIPEIARQLAALADKVRSGSFSVDDLRGSSFTVSNLGAVGGTYSTPMINVPEVAILLLGRARKMPVVVDDEVAVRLMLPLSLSYDHRLVDGAAAARFLNEVRGFLEAPSRLLLAP